MFPTWLDTYILADMRRGRTYVGVTNEGLVDGYTKKNNIKRLSITKYTMTSSSPSNVKRRSSIGIASGRSAEAQSRLARSLDEIVK